MTGVPTAVGYSRARSAGLGRARVEHVPSMVVNLCMVSCGTSLCGGRHAEAVGTHATERALQGFASVTVRLWSGVRSAVCVFTRVSIMRERKTVLGTIYLRTKS